jgi:N-acetylneuraminate lyase
MYDLSIFKGIFIAFYAPYDDNGEISAERAVKAAQFYKDAGVKGLYLCGSSGEGFLLSVEERKIVTEAVCKQFKDDLTIIVHIGAAATRDSVELAKHAEKCGAHALSAVPCVYYHLPESGIELNWNTMIDATNLPFIIYNIPMFTGYDLTLNLLRKMIKNPKVIGVKNTTMNAFIIEQFKKTGGENFVVFNGPDEQFLAGRIMGAEAGIGGTYGVMPELYVRMENFFRQGKIKEAQAIQIKINDVIVDLQTFNCLYSATKEVLRLRGVNVGKVRAPMMPLSEDEKIRAQKLYEKVIKYVEETK